MSTDPIFHQVPEACVCYLPEDLAQGAPCVCLPVERVIRGYIQGDITEPMTEAQRQWCIQEAEDCGEGTYTTEELTPLDDQALARTVLDAWWDYVRSNCLP